MKARTITRTLKTTHVDVILTNKETLEVYESTVVLPGTYKEDKLGKAVAEFIPENSALVKIGAVRVQENLYEAAEADFLAIAKPNMKQEKTEPIAE